MRRLICVVAVAGALAAATPAYGNGWPWPLGSSASLGFGAAWTDGSGRACTHRGIDIAAACGDEVRACADGTVSFCGPVPSSAGGRVVALTVETPDGLNVTYMPLETACASAGEAIAAGQVVGALAATGDGSSPGSHLHLSVKRGELAIDPMTLLGAGASGVPAPAPNAAAGQPPALGVPGGAAAGQAAVSVRPPAPEPVRETHAAALPEPDAVAEPLTSRITIKVPVPAVEGRAIHGLPQGFRVTLPRVSALPAVSAGGAASVCARLLLAAAAALALWARIRRGAVPATVHAAERRT